jgi:hypothetical protein
MRLANNNLGDMYLKLTPTISVGVLGRILRDVKKDPEMTATIDRSINAPPFVR